MNLRSAQQFCRCAAVETLQRQDNTGILGPSIIETFSTSRDNQQMGRSIACSNFVQQELRWPIREVSVFEHHEKSGRTACGEPEMNYGPVEFTASCAGQFPDRVISDIEKTRDRGADPGKIGSA